MHLAVRSAGRQARRLIETAQPATVIAVFARSLYLRDASARIACFGGPGLGEGPLNALCASWPDATEVTTNTTARWDAGVLGLGSLELDATRLRPWLPAPSSSWDAPALKRSLARLSAIPARGLGLAIPTLVAAAPLPAGDRFQNAAFVSLLTLASWMRDPVAEPPATVATLIGLGSGLTPAGDDALGGAVIALRVFGRPDVADRLSGWLLPRARGATSDISFAHLAAAAEGEGAAALHDTLAALAHDDPWLAEGVARLDRIGHSSGWDALAGAVAALVSLAG